MLEIFLGLALGLVQDPNEHPTLIKLILDCSKLINNNESNDNWFRVKVLERQSISLCHSLHVKQYKKFSHIPERKRLMTAIHTSPVFKHVLKIL